jgi:nitrite reductase (NO-forming)
MRRAAAVFVLAMFAAAGVAAGVFVPGGGASATARDATVRITVNASEFKFALSRRSVPKGATVIFKVVNKGKIAHNFKIAGKKTKTLAPGKSTLLKVKFAKKGVYPYLCTITGHAAAGMKGAFAVGVKTTTTTVVTTTTTTPPGTTTTGPPVGNANTTVQVGMFEYRFDLDKTTVPSGNVTFVITNRGQEVHNFDVSGKKAGQVLSPGQSETWTIALAPGQYNYLCDVPFHSDRGMVGLLTVTP